MCEINTHAKLTTFIRTLRKHCPLGASEPQFFIHLEWFVLMSYFFLSTVPTSYLLPPNFLARHLFSIISWRSARGCTLFKILLVSMVIFHQVQVLDVSCPNNHLNSIAIYILHFWYLSLSMWKLTVNLLLSSSSFILMHAFGIYTHARMVLKMLGLSEKPLKGKLHKKKILFMGVYYFLEIFFQYFFNTSESKPKMGWSINTRIL